MSTSSGLELLQIVLEPDTKRYADEDAGPNSDRLGNEAIFIRVWKTSPEMTYFKTMKLTVIRNGSKWIILTIFQTSK